MHLINAFIFAACLSAVNSSIYIGSRSILFVAQERKASRFLGKANSRSVPVPAIIFSNLLGAIFMMIASSGASAAYSYIVIPSGVSTSFGLGNHFSHSHLIPLGMESTRTQSF